ncbi:MAG: type 4a pilus biogenesis protein PilO [Candidatus Omnitrophica bacterium]|nr:type 4a pilus biogenesis protein PilO [Candidatus Omnitrophota bacterium]
MDPKEKQKLMVLLGIFGIAAVVMFYNLLLKPQLAGFSVRNKEYQDIRARVKGAEALIRNKARIKNQHEELKKQTAQLEKRLSLHDEISGLLEDFSRIAESSGVKILRIKPLEVVDDQTRANARSGVYVEFPILIEARAGYHQCGLFVNKLETMEKIIKIEDIDIKGIATDPRRHDIKLRTKAYVIK